MQSSARPLGQAVRRLQAASRSYATKGSQLDKMPEPVKDAWEAPFRPYEWKPKEQYALLGTVAAGVSYAFYRVMTRTPDDKK
jgi:hypothetical protein